MRLDPHRLETEIDEPIAGSARLPGTLVEYVARASEPVMLGQAANDSRFTEDSYLRAQQPASVLAVPLMHQGRLIGVMYLEHASAADAFPAERIEVVTLLASQAATAVENATLYGEVQRKTEALQASNLHLEQLVEQRTAQYRAAKEAADSASQAKSDFLSSMSHELRSPLNGILGYAQILERAAELSLASREGVQIIKKSGEHLLTLISDVLDLAKIEAGRMELVPKDFLFAPFIRTVVNLSRVRADQKKLAFHHESSGRALHTVHADEKRLTQVLLNLLSNAVKFTSEGGVSFHVEVLGEPRDGVCTVCFRVADSGPGIAPEHLARIFEPFEQVGDQKAKSEGTGLGLSITKRIVEEMGGTIALASEVGRGSVFTVTVALEEVQAPVNSAAGAAARPSWSTVLGYQGERRTILVVDDKPDNRAVLRGLLRPLGFEVIEADDGDGALAMVQAQRPALILMDLAMPGMDGYEATRRIRQLPSFADAIVIACSANVSANRIEESTRAGCDDFLPKPIAVGPLLDTLTRFLGLEWLHQGSRPALPAPRADDSIQLPPFDVLQPLCELADQGRIFDFIAETERLQREQPEIAPWLGRVQGLADSFELDALAERLKADLVAVSFVTRS